MEEVLCMVSRNGCKCKYRVRWFYSKGAFLVLVWVMLLTISCISVFQACILNQRYGAVHFVFPKWVYAIPLVFGLLGAVFSGWLADVKLGNYRVMKYSFVLLFFCLFLVLSPYSSCHGIECLVLHRCMGVSF